MAKRRQNSGKAGGDKEKCVEAYAAKTKCSRRCGEIYEILRIHYCENRRQQIIQMEPSREDEFPVSVELSLTPCRVWGVMSSSGKTSNPGWAKCPTTTQPVYAIGGPVRRYARVCICIRLVRSGQVRGVPKLSGFVSDRTQHIYA